VPRNPEKKRCGRTNTSGARAGQPCGKWALKGSTVCGTHGGSAPQVKAAAKQRLAEKAITKALGKLDVKPIHDPLTALAELAGEITAWKELAADRVAQLKALAARNFLSGSDEVHAEIQVYERALDRTVHVLAPIARLNIDERLVRISEQQAELVKQALMGALEDAGLPREQQREAAGHLARRLRLVAG
jgi:hypothetical protein